ncbi:hypothetical protein DL98DRAFT_575367 [Cadophora sp. DSE1049]|nr:hypothetical protein DL98DRAFT_575367 [Cadophora sp. DSE1049]
MADHQPPQFRPEPLLLAAESQIESPAWTGEDVPSFVAQEFDLYRMGPGYMTYKTESNRRLQAFDRIQRQKRYEFLDAESHRKTKIIGQFMNRVYIESAEEVRRRTVPAYAFTRFPNLPPELQLRIWSIASRTLESTIRTLISMKWEREKRHEDLPRRYKLKGSSRIRHDLRDSPVKSTYPSVLRICRDSRAVGLSTFKLFKLDVGCAWIPVAYDLFYIGGDGWKKFKLLIDCLIRENTTRKQDPVVCEDLDKLLRIRHLIVDFNVFAAAPPTIWTHFTDLATLTVAFRPTLSIDQRPVQDAFGPPENPRFITPHISNKYGIRASWILGAANRKLRTVLEDRPKWKIPHVDVTVRAPDNAGLKMAIQEPGMDQSLGSDAEGPDQIVVESEQEATWLEQATTRIAHIVSDAQIRKLKRRHHPSRYLDIWDMDFQAALQPHEGNNVSTREPDTYYTDSENESGTKWIPDEVDLLSDHEDWFSE